MDYLLREAKEHDYEGLTQIYNQVDSLHAEALPQIFMKVNETFECKYVSRIIKGENSVIFVAESDSNIIGLIKVEIRESPIISMMVKRRYTYVSTIVVTETSRRSGIGKDLMRQAEKRAFEKEISEGAEIYTVVRIEMVDPID